jgi:hypothetical protein
VSAGTGIAFNNISGLNDLTAASNTGVITLNGNVTASGNIALMNDVVVTGAKTALSANNMFIEGGMTGPGSLTLNATGAAQNTISGIVNLSGALTLNNGFSPR